MARELEEAKNPNLAQKRVLEGTLNPIDDIDMEAFEGGE
jgi:hypothetical protein